MGALAAVAQGSHEPAQFIILEHRPEGVDADTAPVVLCGKGVTFDSGGISIKPSQGMGDMKGDMGGAAAVLGAMRALRALNVPVHVIGLLPATENLPDGRAFRPGDVIRAMDGQSIEIISTDAEGRLILADAMVYARRYTPRALVDIATLTGACMVALGAKVAGVMGNADVVARLRTAGDAVNERVWELPLWADEYGKMIDSDVADMKNAGGRNGGAISAGKFLERFAGDSDWAHIDMAGLEINEGELGPYRPKGASGYGVRLLVEFVSGYAAGH
jgi:leucyl aminopeptidase